MKYAVIEYRNPEMDVCRNHPSYIATMLDGGDPWPVTATGISRLFNTSSEATKKLQQLFSERQAELDERVCPPWVITEGDLYTLYVAEFDIDEGPKVETMEWVFKMEVVDIPETDEEARLI